MDFDAAKIDRQTEAAPLKDHKNKVDVAKVDK